MQPAITISTIPSSSSSSIKSLGRIKRQDKQWQEATTIDASNALMCLKNKKPTATTTTTTTTTTSSSSSRTISATMMHHLGSVHHQAAATDKDDKREFKGHDKGQNDEQEARDDAPITNRTNGQHRRQASETIPLLVLLPGAHHSSSSLAAFIEVNDLVTQEIILMDLEPPQQTKTKDSAETFVSISTHEENCIIDMVHDGFSPDESSSLMMDDDDGISLSLLLETTTSVAADEMDSSVDYCVSRSLQVPDETYFTQGFVDVGELPRVY